MTTDKGGEGQDNQKNITTHIKEALLDKKHKRNNIPFTKEMKILYNI